MAVCGGSRKTKVCLFGVRWVARTVFLCTGVKEKNALRVDLISGIEGASFAVGLDGKGVVTGLVVGTSHA